jgi:hypothetical protein
MTAVVRSSVIPAQAGIQSETSNVPFYVQKRLLNKAWAVMVRG